MSNLKWHGKRAEQLVRSGASAGLKKLGERIEGSSNAIAPRDTQEMIDSSEVTVRGLNAVVSYDTSYAVRQHEDLTLRHSPGRRAKFLESAAKQHAPAAPGIVGSEIAGKLR